MKQSIIGVKKGGRKTCTIVLFSSNNPICSSAEKWNVNSKTNRIQKSRIFGKYTAFNIQADRDRYMDEQRKKREYVDDVRKANQSMSMEIMNASKVREDYLPHSDFN